MREKSEPRMNTNGHEEILDTDLHGIDTDLRKDFFTTKTRRHEDTKTRRRSQKKSEPRIPNTEEEREGI